MTTITDTRDPFLEDSVQNCKKCNLPIYEGHAYELGDDRWHINCFKCSKCNSSLGCNSNFLVLGNGNLICSNCSYNCKQCGKKIDDLAILTGDQAYCSSCFKCRACKQKIEDLRYARTSKGLFCMSCHEKLMAKKKKHDAKKKAMRKVKKDRLPSQSHPNGSSSTIEVPTPLMKEMEEKPIYQPKPQPAPSLQSQSDLYDLYDHSQGSTPRITSKNSSSEVFHDITRSSSSMSKDKDLPSTPDLMKDANLEAKRKPPVPEVKNPEPKKAAIEREFSIEEINDSDDELNKRKGSKPSPALLEPPVDLSQNLLKPMDSPTSISHTKFQGKNLLILSPGQNVDEGLKTPKSPESQIDKDSLHTEDPVRSRSNCPSPLARNNRHARVLDAYDNDNDNNDNNDTLGDETVKDDTNKTIESSLPEPLSELTTPKKRTYPANPNLSLPPPRVPLPSVPSVPNTPKSNSQMSDNYYLEKAIHNDEFLNGLGLEGVEYNEYHDLQKRRSNLIIKNSKVIVNPTPTVTNLEDHQDSILTRKQSIIKTPRLGGLRHKRSVSGGSNSGDRSISKLNIFRSREDRGHSRHISDGSINGSFHSNNNSTMMAPGFTMALHSRSNSENNYINPKNFEFSDNVSVPNEFDMKSLRLEISQLESQKQNLLTDVKKLQEEKSKLAEDIDTMRVKYTEEFKRYNSLSREVTDMKYKRDFESKRDIDSKASSSADDTTTQGLQNKISHHTSNSSSSLLNTVVDLSIDDSIETQKATKLKFWRRAKLGFNNNGPTMVVPSASSNQLRVEDDESKKGFGIMTKSRSTNILDTFLNNNSSENESEVPLFSSSIEKRVKFENTAIPLIITRCLQEVEDRGLDLEGIYRISGGNLQIIAIEQAFSNINPKIKDDKNLNKLNEVLDCDINAVTSALKRYLRKIPDPLIPFSVYTDFIKLNSVQDEKKKIAEFKLKVIEKLPDSNREVLQKLCKHLELVNSYSSVNRMNNKNLSVVFAPTIARDETGQREMMDMGSRNDMTEFLLTNFNQFF